MKQFAAILLAVLCLVLAMHVQAVAQTHDRSIEDSWERSSSQPGPTGQPGQQPAAPRGDASGSSATRWDAPVGDVHPAPGANFPSWDAGAPPAAGAPPPAGKPPASGATSWQRGTGASASGGSLTARNAALIDSLSNLYCVSSTYIAVLRSRNEQTRGSVSVPAPAGKDFQYKPAPAVEVPTGTESADALHRELLLLLERCLYGKQ